MPLIPRPVATLASDAVTQLRQWSWPYRIIAETTDRSFMAGVGVTGLLALALTVLGSVASGAVGLVVGLLLIAAWIAGGLAAMRWWMSYRTSVTRDRHRLLSRDGFASASEIERTVGETAMRAKAEVIRPRLAAERRAELEHTGAAFTKSEPLLCAHDVAWRLGTSRTKGVWAISEIPIYLLGPARSGKGFGILISAIMEAVGAVVTTSTRADNMNATIRARSMVGPVYIFDPEGASGRATSLPWSPLTGCHLPAIAKKRAMTLVGGTGLGGENAIWANSSGGIVQCLLHAAAIDGRPIEDCYRWSRTPSAAHEATAILEQNSPTDWSRTIEAIRGEDPRMKSSKWLGVENAFAALAVPEVRAALNTRPTDPGAFDPRAFLLAKGTLYMVSQWKEVDATAGGVGTFFSLLLDVIADAAHEISMSPGFGDRLDPPAAMVLDEIANIHPWAKLPQAAAAGSGEGLQVVYAFQSRSQARAAYGADVERGLWSNATKVILGGESDTPDLRELSDLLHTRAHTVLNTSWSGVGLGNRSNQESTQERPLASIDELRRFPENLVLVIVGRVRPIIVTLEPWPTRPWAHLIHESKAWHAATPGHVGPVPAPPQAVAP